MNVYEVYTSNLKF